MPQPIPLYLWQRVRSMESRMGNGPWQFCPAARGPADPLLPQRAAQGALTGRRAATPTSTAARNTWKDTAGTCTTAGRGGTIPPSCAPPSPDPLAEKYYDTSPYAWCGNNPVNAVDPTGMEWFYYSTDGESDPTWNWRDETEYRTGVYDTNGNEVVLQGHEAVVVFEGSLDERLGEDGTLTGENSKAANVTIYGINGADDIKTYKGLTVTSNPDKYSMVKSGEYNLSWEQMQTSPYGKGSLTYRIRQLNGNEQLPIEGGGLNKATEKSYLSAVFLHRTNWSGSAIYSSQGCLIIDGRQWKSVEQQLQKTTGNMLLQIYR